MENANVQEGNIRNDCVAFCCKFNLLSGIFIFHLSSSYKSRHKQSGSLPRASLFVYLKYSIMFEHQQSLLEHGANWKMQTVLLCYLNHTDHETEWGGQGE